MKMKAMLINQPGPAESFELKEIDRPQIRPNHLIIEVRATSVNPIDTKVRAHHLPFSPDYPAILHVDFAGIVVEVAADVIGFKKGDSVYGLAGGIKGTPNGALAQYIVVDADLTSLMPKNLSFGEAAALPLVSITAWEALVDKLNISSGHTLLVHAGLGGVGHIAAQLGKYLGAIVHTTISNDQDVTLAKSFGADHVINYKNSQPDEYIKEFTANQGFDFVFDTVGGENLEKSFAATRYNGSVACISTGGNHDLTTLFVRGLSLHSVLMLIPLFTGKGRKHYGKILTEIKKLVEEGKLKPLIHKETFNWKDVASAHLLQESGKQKGKIVILID